MKKLCVVVAMLGVFLPVIAMAVPIDTQTFYFNVSNEFGPWTGSTPPGYGSVTVYEDSEDGYIYFEVDANSDYFTPEEDLVWDKFFFNTELGDGAFSIVVDESYGTWTTIYDQNASMFGVFDVGERGTSIGNESVNPFNFHIVGSDLSVDDFIGTNDEGNLFAGHVRRFDAIDGETSTYLAVTTSSVPEPGTLILLGVGLLGLGITRRRKHLS